MGLDLEFTFDPKTYRHYRDGHLTVLHCHHYLALTTKLAEDFAHIGGVNILSQAAEDTTYHLLEDYYQKHSVAAVSERFGVAREYYSVMGLGLMDFEEGDVGVEGGKVRLLRSHVDLGWIKKWGKHTKHINHFSRGYIAGMLAAIFSKPARSYEVTELESKVTGADFNVFEAKLLG
jgi:hypothetical protein